MSSMTRKSNIMSTWISLLLSHCRLTLSQCHLPVHPFLKVLLSTWSLKRFYKSIKTTYLLDETLVEDDIPTGELTPRPSSEAPRFGLPPSNGNEQSPRSAQQAINLPEFPGPNADAVQPDPPYPHHLSHIQERTVTEKCTATCSNQPARVSRTNCRHCSVWSPYRHHLSYSGSGFASCNVNFAPRAYTIWMFALNAHLFHLEWRNDNRTIWAWSNERTPRVTSQLSFFFSPQLLSRSPDSNEINFRYSERLATCYQWLHRILSRNNFIKFDNITNLLLYYHWQFIILATYGELKYLQMIASSSKHELNVNNFSWYASRRAQYAKLWRRR